MMDYDIPSDRVTDAVRLTPGSESPTGLPAPSRRLVGGPRDGPARRRPAPDGRAVRDRRPRHPAHRHPCLPALSRPASGSAPGGPGVRGRAVLGRLRRSGAADVGSGSTPRREPGSRSSSAAPWSLLASWSAAVWISPSSGPRVVAEEDRLVVVNGYQRRDFAWPQVIAVRLPPGAPWVTRPRGRHDRPGDGHPGLGRGEGPFGRPRAPLRPGHEVAGLTRRRRPGSPGARPAPGPWCRSSTSRRSRPRRTTRRDPLRHRQGGCPDVDEAADDRRRERRPVIVHSWDDYPEAARRQGAAGYLSRAWAPTGWSRRSSPSTTGGPCRTVPAPAPAMPGSPGRWTASPRESRCCRFIAGPHERPDRAPRLPEHQHGQDLHPAAYRKIGVTNRAQAVAWLPSRLPPRRGHRPRGIDPRGIDPQPPVRSSHVGCWDVVVHDDVGVVERADGCEVDPLRGDASARANDARPPRPTSLPAPVLEHGPRSPRTVSTRRRGGPTRRRAPAAAGRPRRRRARHRLRPCWEDGTARCLARGRRRRCRKRRSPPGPSGFQQHPVAECVVVVVVVVAGQGRSTPLRRYRWARGKRNTSIVARMTSRPSARRTAASSSASVVFPAAGGPSMPTRVGWSTATRPTAAARWSSSSSRVPLCMLPPSSAGEGPWESLGEARRRRPDRGAVRARGCPRTRRSPRRAQSPRGPGRCGTRRPVQSSARPQRDRRARPGTSSALEDLEPPVPPVRPPAPRCAGRGIGDHDRRRTSPSRTRSVNPSSNATSRTGGPIPEVVRRPVGRPRARPG